MKEKFKELPKDKIETINSIIAGSPNFVVGSPWLSFYPCEPSAVFNNSIILEKAVAAAIVVSGSAIYSFDVIRKDGKIFDTDRHRFFLSGANVLINRKIDKDFPEHHSQEIPIYYNKADN